MILNRLCEQDSMVWVEALVPFDKGELLSTIHQVGMVEKTVSINICMLILFYYLILLHQKQIIHHKLPA